MERDALLFQEEMVMDFCHSLSDGCHRKFFARTDVWPCAERHGVVLEPPLALVEVNLGRHVFIQEAIVLEAL